MMRQSTNTRNSIASNTQHQPLAGKDSAGVTKTLAESERRQLHPLVPEGREAWRERWNPLWKVTEKGAYSRKIKQKRC